MCDRTDVYRAMTTLCLPNTMDGLNFPLGTGGHMCIRMPTVHANKKHFANPHARLQH